MNYECARKHTHTKQTHTIGREKKKTLHKFQSKYYRTMLYFSDFLELPEKFRKTRVFVSTIPKGRNKKARHETHSPEIQNYRIRPEPPAQICHVINHINPKQISEHLNWS